MAAVFRANPFAVRVFLYGYVSVLQILPVFPRVQVQTCRQRQTRLEISRVLFSPSRSYSAGTINGHSTGCLVSNAETGADRTASVRAVIHSLVVPPEAKYTGREMLAGERSLSLLSRAFTAVSAISATGWTMVEQTYRRVAKSTMPS